VLSDLIREIVCPIGGFAVTRTPVQTSLRLPTHPRSPEKHHEHESCMMCMKVGRVRSRSQTDPNGQFERLRLVGCRAIVCRHVMARSVTIRSVTQAAELPDRVLHTFRTAVKTTFFTSATSIASFAANALSTIPAVHDFGLLSALLVVRSKLLKCA
jgi:hypothetical protein